MYSKPWHKSAGFGPVSGLDEFASVKKNRAYLENIHKMEESRKKAKEERDAMDEKDGLKKEERGLSGLEAASNAHQKLIG